MFSAEPYKGLILEKLNNNLENYRQSFQASKSQVGTRFLAIDDLLPHEMAMKIFELFPKDGSSWREMKSYRETKLTSKDFNRMPKELGNITFAIQDPEVIKAVEKITEIPNQYADPSLYAGGLSMMRKGDFLNPHIDNSHDHERKRYRRVNLLYYVSPNWKREDGGHLELWDEKVKTPVVIESRFNRLVLMETHHLSWHSVSRVEKEGFRCCVSNYYFSPQSPLDREYFHVTSFSGRPEEPVKRLLCVADNAARMLVRKVKREGIGKKDLFVQK